LSAAGDAVVTAAGIALDLAFVGLVCVVVSRDGFMTAVCFVRLVEAVDDSMLYFF